MNTATKRISLILIMASIFSLVFAQSDGTLDPDFGTDGLVMVDNNNNTDDGNDMILIEEKGIVVGGTSIGSGYDFSFCGLTTSGGLNTSFGTDGKFLWDIENGSDDYLNALALDADQRIVGAGYSIIGPDQYIVLVRMSTEGVPDSTFGVNGIVKLNPVVTSVAYDVAIQPDNKIVVAGYVFDGLSPEKALVMRLNHDGTYDGAFGDNGIWEGSPDPIANTRGYSVALQPDGKILVGGYHDIATYEFAVARILAGGAMDVSFEIDGWAVNNISGGDDVAYSIALQNDGKIVMAGVSNGEVTICRFNSDGTGDAGFADNGTFTDPLLANDDILYDVIVQPDNKILAVGGASIDDNVDFVLIRVTPEGALDSTFDTDGVVYTNFNFSNDYAYSVLLQPDQKILAAGSALNGYFTDFAVARYSNEFATGINSSDDQLQVMVSPNPTDRNCRIQIDGLNLSGCVLDVMDITGRKCICEIIPQGEQFLSLDMSHRPAGLYMIEIRNQSGKVIVREKFVIL